MKRRELYTRAWAEPMIRLAEELGMSDPGLAKLCQRYAIPTPPRGHWAKLQAGKRSPQAPLRRSRTRPAVVRVMPLRPRESNGTPTDSSIARSRSLADGNVIWLACAPAVIVPAS